MCLQNIKPVILRHCQILQVSSRADKLTYLLPVIPASVIHPLAQQFNGRLGTVRFQHGHVQIINEEDEIFPQRRPEHTFTSVNERRLLNS